MLTIFNRKELAVSFGTGRQSQVRELLTQNGIKYKIKTINRKSPSSFDSDSRARTGTLKENLERSYEYVIYVHKNDYDKAISIIKAV